MNSSNQNNDYSYNDYSDNNDSVITYRYEPVMKQKKKDDNILSDILHSGEVKVLIFVVFILIIFFPATNLNIKRD